MVPFTAIPSAPPAHVISISDLSAQAETIPHVPFYSQFIDISSLAWRKKSCGMASLAMIINFYDPGIVSAQKLLEKGIAAGAYMNGVGWTHQGIVSLADRYGLSGDTYDLSNLSKNDAFAQLEDFLVDGPVIASVHYKFNPKSPIPHLVVVNGIDGDNVSLNDPAAKSGGEKISIPDFIAGWKKRFIVIRPS